MVLCCKSFPIPPTFLSLSSIKPKNKEWKESLVSTTQRWSKLIYKVVTLICLTHSNVREKCISVQHKSTLTRLTACLPLATWCKALRNLTLKDCRGGKQSLNTSFARLTCSYNNKTFLTFLFFTLTGWKSLFRFCRTGVLSGMLLNSCCCCCILKTCRESTNCTDSGKFLALLFPRFRISPTTRSQFRLSLTLRKLKKKVRRGASRVTTRY